MTIEVVDQNLQPIKDVEFAVYRDKDKKEKLLNPLEEINWDERSSSYKLRHGLCGAHYGAILEIGAKTYDSLEGEIDMPLNREETSQRVRAILKKRGSNERAFFERYTRLTGTVTDDNGAVISGATVTIIGPDRFEKYLVTSDEGQLNVLLRPGNYSITIEKSGFQKWELKKYRIAAFFDPAQRLDVVMEIMPLNDPHIIYSDPIEDKKKPV